MSANTSIAWTEKSWNPVVGCTKVSAGCVNCYAHREHNRIHQLWKDGRRPSAPQQYHRPFNEIQLMPQRLEDPKRWRKPTMIFVNSWSDLFHEAVPQEFIEQVLDVIAACPRHTFQVLTKRPERLYVAMSQWLERNEVPKNLWLGVTAENQEQAEKRIPVLLSVPAQIHWVSAEPLLGPMQIRKWLQPSIERGSSLNWCVTGAESGTGRRPVDPDWVRSLRDQCVEASVPFFFKQWSGYRPKSNGCELDGRIWHEFPVAI